MLNRRALLQTGSHLCASTMAIAAQSCACELGARATARARPVGGMTSTLMDDLCESRWERSIMPQRTYEIGTVWFAERPVRSRSAHIVCPNGGWSAVWST